MNPKVKNKHWLSCLRWFISDLTCNSLQIITAEPHHMIETEITNLQNKLFSSYFFKFVIAGIEAKQPLCEVSEEKRDPSDEM